MQSHLKFKQTWFNILNKCDRQLRTDVLDAVMQYFFTGAEPSFTDDARIIAFGFIKADIDECRNRAKSRKESNVSMPESETHESIDTEAETVTEPEAVADASTEVPPIEQNPVTEEERQQVYTLICNWNGVTKNTKLPIISPTIPPDSQYFTPVLHAIRKKTFKKVQNAIMRLKAASVIPDYHDFFEALG